MGTSITITFIRTQKEEFSKPIVLLSNGTKLPADIIKIEGQWNPACEDNWVRYFVTGGIGEKLELLFIQRGSKVKTTIRRHEDSLPDWLLQKIDQN